MIQEREDFDVPPSVQTPTGGELAAVVGTPTDGDVLAFDSGVGGYVPTALGALPGVNNHLVGATFDGGGAALTLTGTIKLRVRAIASGTITLASITALGSAGDITIGIKAGSFGGALSDITGGADLEITGDTEMEDATLTGWALSVTAGDVFEFELKATSGAFTQATVQLFYQ